MSLAAWLVAASLSAAPAPCPEAAAADLEAARTAREAGDLARAEEALTACTQRAPRCADCQRQLGWIHYNRGKTKEATAAWIRLLKLVPADHATRGALGRLLQGKPTLHVPVGTVGTGEGPIRLRLVARFQSYEPKPSHPADHYDADVDSPKSARFSADGTRVYVNALEAHKTLVFDPKTLTRVGSISHTFTKADAALFQGETTVFGYPYLRTPPTGDPNQMSGKPVESELSHGGRYLWTPYYRRSFDVGSASPSAVAVVDTTTDKVVRVLPTGPIPKYVAASPDQEWLAVTHWGDNTLGVVDTSSGDASSFKYLPNRLVVDQAMSMESLTGKDRDKECGSCLRGTVFTPDSRVLLVARMGTGGVAGFEVGTWRYLGTALGEPRSPRHLLVTRDGKWLYLSANASGKVARIPLSRLVAALREARGGLVTLKEWETVHVGGGARTIAFSPDERFVYAASNARAELVVVDTQTFRVVHRVRTDAFTVGLAVSPDGRQVWTTSQGHEAEGGGRSTCVFAVELQQPAGQPTGT